MNKIITNRVLLLIAIILLSSNLIILSFIWFKSTTTIEQPAKEIINRPGRNNFEHRIASELNLSSEQFDRYHELKKVHMVRIRSLRDSIKQNKWLIHQELMSKNPDINYINQLSDSIGQLNAEFEKINYSHFYKLRKGLNEEQLVKYKNMLDKLPYGKRNHDNTQKHRNRR